MISSTSSSAFVQQLTWAVNLTKNKILFLNQAIESTSLDDFQIPDSDALPFLLSLNIQMNPTAVQQTDPPLKAVATPPGFKILSQAHLTEVNDQNILFGTSNILSSDKLKKLNQNLFQETADLKSKFLNNITHEFKAPITRIQGLTEIIRIQYPHSEIEEYLDLIQLCTDKLKFTAESILEFSKWDKKNSRSGFENVSIYLLIKSLINELDTQLQRKNIGIDLKASDSSIQSITNPKVLKEALKLILMTAIENTQQGVISIEINSENGRLCVNVLDSGKGIPNDFIFGDQKDMLTLLHTETKNSRQKQRSGLILSIAADYLNELGGSLEAKQLNPERNQFTICVPTSLN